jgi:hypothetical protein
MPTRPDVTNKIFNDLTILEYTPGKNGVKSTCVCRCICGNVKTIRTCAILSGHTRSCGCAITRPRENTHLIKHGMSNTSMYRCFQDMKKRTTPNGYYQRKYPSYIGVNRSELWETFIGFKANQPKGRVYEKGLCLCRFGDKGDYTPENTRWDTKSANATEGNLIGHRYHKKLKT